MFFSVSSIKAVTSLEYLCILCEESTAIIVMISLELDTIFTPLRAKQRRKARAILFIIIIIFLVLLKRFIFFEIKTISIKSIGNINK